MVEGINVNYTVTESHQSFVFYPFELAFTWAVSAAARLSFLRLLMELLAGNCRKRLADDDFAEDVDPFGGSDWMYGGRSLRSQGNDDALATLADLAPPPQKLKPIRCVVNKASLEDRHPLDILAGSLDRLPEMGFLEDFDAPLGSKIADVEESGLLTRGVGKGLRFETEVQGQIHDTSRDGVSLR